MDKMMAFPDLNQEKERLADFFAREAKVPLRDVRVIASPYRICPLGAHIDHQGGPVLGMTIDAYTLMAFVPRRDAALRLCSRNYPGEVNFGLDEIPEAPGSFWGVYPRAAALALREEFPLERGLIGLLDGMLPGCGLSSSASVLLAYLCALADVNRIRLQPWDYVRLTRRAENTFIGLKNGILDQTSIVFGRKNHLLHIDTRAEKVSAWVNSREAAHFRILVAYSGYSRELTTSGYNSRVDECREAAARLAEIAGCAPARILSDVPEEAFGRHGSKLAPLLRRRAGHYFGEVRRVRDGLAAWCSGHMEAFGRLMRESCQSSMEQYECGIQPIHDLQQIVGSAAGVFGSRFMGGGFGGCVVGFAAPERAPAAAAEVQAAYRRLHPEVADQAAVFLAASADGVRFL